MGSDILRVSHTIEGTRTRKEERGQRLPKMFLVAEGIKKSVFRRKIG
jgi:hypothetical protein